MNRADRRASWQGMSDGMNAAVEIAVMPVIFALGGLWLDGRFGTKPVFAVALAIFAAVGTFVRAYYQYTSRLDALEEGKAWRRQP